MAKNTSNYNLKKPSSEDFYNVEDQNGNMDIIDQELKRLNEDNQYTDQKISSVSSDLSSHLSDIAHVPHLGTTSNAGNAYSITTTKVIGVNQKFTIRFNVPATGPATLKLSTMTAAAPIKKTGLVDAIVKFGYYTMFWDGENFQLLGEGGEIPKLPNLVYNGNYRDTPGWAGFNSTIYATNNILNVAGDGTYRSAYTFNTIDNSVYPYKGGVGKKIWITARVRVTNAVCNSFVVYVSNKAANASPNLPYIFTPTQNTWYLIRGIITLSFDDTYKIYIRSDYADAATANGKLMQVKDVMLFDLTEYFGEGNEPTAGEVSTMVDKKGKNLFDGILEIGALSTVTGLPADNNDLMRSKNFIPIIPSTSYVTSKNDIAANMGFWFYNQDKVFISYTTNSQGLFTTPSNAYFLKIRTINSGDNNIYSHVQIEEGVTVTPFEYYLKYDWWDSELGSMPDRTFAANGGAYTPASSWKADGGGALCVRPQEGYYKSEVNGNGYGPIAATDPNFIPANIVSGKSIFGVAGTGIGFPDGWNEAVTARAWENITKFDPIVLKKMGIWENGVNKLTNPSVLPDGSAWGCSFSPDGNYLAITHIISPYLTIYKRSGDIFIKLINPTVLPDGPAWDCSFSPDSNYLAVAHGYSQGIIIYKRNGDTFTKSVVPSVPGSLIGFSCSFSTDGNYLAVGISISPYLIIYKRNGDTFTKLADPVNTPTSYVKSCSFSSDSNYLAVGNEDSPYLVIYRRNGDTFTKLADPAVLPAGNGQGCCFSPDGNYLAIGHYGPPYLTIYKRNGNTFTKLADPTILPIGSEGACAFSPDGNYLAVGGSNAPYLIIYKRNGDTFTKLPDPTNLPTSGPLSCSFGTDGNYLAMGLYGSPFLIIYKSDAYDSIQKITSKSQYFYSPPVEWKFGIAMETKSTGEIGKATLFPKLYNLSNV